VRDVQTGLTDRMVQQRHVGCFLVFPEDGDRIQSPKRCVLKNKDRTMDNVQKHHICNYTKGGMRKV
jgi:hypothetical protein